MKLKSLALIAIALLSCNGAQQEPPQKLPGAWKAKIQFQNGPFAAIKDFEFLYVFNQGGTMTESSNYDAAPPVPPAYGIWKALGSNRYEAKYKFYITRIPTSAEKDAASGGWLPAGYGMLDETIELSQDGNSYTSTIQYEAFDITGKATDRATATGKGIRFKF
jgi:hypothetical protein